MTSPRTGATATSKDGLDLAAAGLFCRLQVAGCRLKFHYNWKTADTKTKGKAIDLP